METNLADYTHERAAAVLRRQKPRETRKRHKAREALVSSVRISGSVLAVTLVTFALLLTRDILLQSRKFNVTDLQIHGLRFVPESQVLQKLTESKKDGMSLLALDLGRLRNSIELLPWVKEVTVQRTLPGKLDIYIQERIPIAYAKIDQGTLLVDDDGILLEKNPEILSHFDFPVIVGFEAGFDLDTLAQNKKRISIYRALIQSLNDNGAGLSRDISEIYLQDPEDVAVILNGDTVLVHLGIENFQQRVRRYLAMSSDLKRKYPLLDSVDLRYQDQVIINTANEQIRTQAMK
jgi:cell division septal protein FtsQ